MKWWKRRYFYILEVCSFNAFTLEQPDRSGSDKRDFPAFRIALAEELIGSFTSRVGSAGRPRSSVTKQEIRLDTTKSHLPLVEDPSITLLSDIGSSYYGRTVLPSPVLFL